MAIYRYVLHEADAKGWAKIGPEVEEIRCFNCGAEASFQVCPGDGRPHHHGEVHRPGGGLAASCNNCIGIVEQEWEDRRHPNPGKALVQ